MTAITTTLTTSGNSTAVRLPKELLKMSGLTHTVTIEAKKGKIIISKPANPREGWAEQIQTLTATHSDPTQEFTDIRAAAQDGLAELPWDGPSFEDWQKDYAQLP